MVYDHFCPTGHLPNIPLLCWQFDFNQKCRLHVDFVKLTSRGICRSVWLCYNKSKSKQNVFLIKPIPHFIIHLHWLAIDYGPFQYGGHVNSLERPIWRLSYFISNHGEGSGILLANPNTGGGIIWIQGSKISRGLCVVKIINGNYFASEFLKDKILHYTAF